MQQVFCLQKGVQSTHSTIHAQATNMVKSLQKKDLISNAFQKLKLNTKSSKNKVPQEEYKKYPIDSQRDFWCSHQWNYTLLLHLNTLNRGKTEVQPVCGMSKKGRWFNAHHLKFRY